MNKITNSRDAVKKSCFDFIKKWKSHSLVQETCDYLRNQYSLNTNLLLLCCWLASVYRRLNRDNIRKLENHVRVWRYQVLERLKELNRALSMMDNELVSLTADVTEVLDDAEWVELSLMLQLIVYIEEIPSENNAPINIAFGNIFDYLNYLGVKLHKNDLEKIYRMVNQLF